MASSWFDRTRASSSALQERLSDASDALLSTMRDANHAIARNASSGIDLAREYGGDLVAGARRYGKSTRGLIAERPVESVVIVALTGIAIGWIWRRMREPSSAAPARAATRTARKTAAPRRKAGAAK